MDRLQERKPAGIGIETVRTWGLLFLAAGIIGRGVIQNGLLDIGGLGLDQMLDRLSSVANGMTLASVSIILQAMEHCAPPIFALLLVEGLQRTASRRDYFLRIAGLALLSELPYNLAIHGNLLELGSRNPVFGLVLSLMMLLFFQRLGDTGAANTVCKLLVAVGAVAWCIMLRVEGGGPLAVMTAVLWLMRGRTMYRSYMGAAAAVVCSIFSPFYLAAPMGFLVVHMYNSDRDGEKPLVPNRLHYFWYPGMLAAAAAAAILL